MKKHSNTILFSKVRDEGVKQVYILRQLKIMGFDVKAPSLSAYLKGTRVPDNVNILKAICNIVQVNYNDVLAESKK